MATLYLVGTPIGNLDDFSSRAITTLKEVSLIACEDTRTSGHLLKHYGIDTPKTSFHQHNEHQKVAYLIELLDSGQNIALITDAGLPGISDPGFLATREAHKLGHTVCCIPGASAPTTALVASGLPCDKYVYEGFLPVKKGRKTRLEQLSDEERTLILLESTHRIGKLLSEICTFFGEERIVAVCRELTKHFEEIVRGSARNVLLEFEQRKQFKGEIVVVIAGKNYTE